MKNITIKTLLHTLLIFIGLLSLNTQAGVEITYIHNDALGTPVAGTDEQGNVKWRAHYQPYGEELLGERQLLGVRAGYTGHRDDPETGLTYMGARYYSPTIGRFMGVDPADVDSSNIHSFNRYAYANNNPYKYVDPDGQATALAACAAGPGACAIGIVVTIFAIDQGIRGTQDALRNENANDDSAGESGTCPTCGGKTEDKTGKIANDTDMTDQEVRDKIHEVKNNIPTSSTTKNPDVEVCTTCGEVFPKAPDNKLGDSVGNIFDQ